MQRRCVAWRPTRLIPGRKQHAGERVGAVWVSLQPSQRQDSKLGEDSPLVLTSSTALASSTARRARNEEINEEIPHVMQDVVATSRTETNFGAKFAVTFMVNHGRHI
jgi:hypothetical protein